MSDGNNNTEGKGYSTEVWHRELGQLKQEAQRERKGKLPGMNEAGLLYNLSFILQVTMWLVGEELADPKFNSFTDPEGDLKF